MFYLNFISVKDTYYLLLKNVYLDVIHMTYSLV
jgi:hypothetical protein